MKTGTSLQNPGQALGALGGQGFQTFQTVGTRRRQGCQPYALASQNMSLVLIFIRGWIAGSIPVWVIGNFHSINPSGS